jgi:hypothetical protein
MLQSAQVSSSVFVSPTTTGGITNGTRSRNAEGAMWESRLQPEECEPNRLKPGLQLHRLNGHCFFPTPAPCDRRPPPL